jgi:hypothetical protein
VLSHTYFYATGIIPAPAIKAQVWPLGEFHVNFYNLRENTQYRNRERRLHLGKLLDKLL